MSETFVLVDIEADGPVPGRHSMLSFAAVAFNLDRTIIGSFERNLVPLPGAGQDPHTEKWWARFPEALAACQENQIDPAIAMPEFVAWLKELPEQPAIFVANPVSFDWAYMVWYLHAFSDYIHAPAHHPPFHLCALDMQSYAAALLDMPFRDVRSATFPKEWKKHKFKHTHRAIDDAMGSAMTFCGMVEAAKQKREPQA